MSDPKISLLIKFLHQNEGRLSKRAREKEFSALSHSEIERLEQQFIQIFQL